MEQLFAELYENYVRRLRAVAKGFVEDEPDALEVVQATFCKAWQHRHTFEVKIFSFSGHFSPD